jgi:hypothetical protein
MSLVETPQVAPVTSVDNQVIETYDLNEEGLPFMEIRESEAVDLEEPIADPVGSKRKGVAIDKAALEKASKEDADLLEFLRVEEEKEVKRAKKSVRFSASTEEKPVEIVGPKSATKSTSVVQDNVVEHESLEGVTESDLEDFMDFKQVAVAYHQLRPTILGAKEEDEPAVQDLAPEERFPEPIPQSQDEPKKLSRFKQQMLEKKTHE